MLPNAQREVYLDYAAATPLDPSVASSMLPYYTERFYNPSAPYALARAVKTDVEQARARIARVLGARPGTVTFTAGATEANNLAFATVTGQVVCDAIEHESVLACVEARDGTIVDVGADGRVDPDEVRRAITPQTELVSIELANGEIGTIQPIRRISQVIREVRMQRLEQGNSHPLLLHTDASQAAGHVSLNVSTLGCDLMTLSAAKVYGPKQVGLLWHADGVALRPLVRGGGQEGGIRSGTENVAGIVGFACALELAERLRSTEHKRLGTLSNRLRAHFSRELPTVVFSGPANLKNRLPSLVHMSVPSIEARRVVIALERRGVSVGTGSACAASRMRVSHVLRAIGLSEQTSAGSLRLTLGRQTTTEDIDYAAAAIVQCVREELRRFSQQKGEVHG